MRVLIHHNNASGWQKALAERLPEASFANSGDRGDFQADYLVAWNPPAELLESQKALRGIVNTGAGVDALLDNPSLPRGVPIVKLRDAGMGDLIADYCRYGVLYFRRDFDRYRDLQSTGQWHRIDVTSRQSWPIGVLGLGAIGAHVAQALATDGYPVLGWSRSPKSVENISCYCGNDGLFELIGQAQTLITLLPNTPETRKIVNARTLAALPSDATLINPGRGALSDDAAVLDALDGKNGQSQLRGALLDTFHNEPLPAVHPFWHHPRVVITPHIAGPTPIEQSADQVAEVLRALDAGEPVDTVDLSAGY